MRAKMSRLAVKSEILCGQNQREAAMHLYKTMQATYNCSQDLTRSSRAKARLQRMRKQQNERETRKSNSTECASVTLLGTAQARTSRGTLRLTGLPVKTTINQQAS